MGGQPLPFSILRFTKKLTYSACVSGIISENKQSSSTFRKIKLYFQSIFYKLSFSHE